MSAGTVAEYSGIWGGISTVLIATAAVVQGEIRAWLGRRREARAAERAARPARPPVRMWGTSTVVVDDEVHVTSAADLRELPDLFADEDDGDGRPAADGDMTAIADATRESLPRRIPGATLPTERLPEAPYPLLHAMYEDVRRITREAARDA